MRQPIIVPLLTLCIGIGAAQASHAELGGTAAHVAVDAAQLHATRRVASQADYDVHELTLACGTVVREFVAPTGAVFAVTWQGPVKPDLRQLLGVHFERLVAAGRSPHPDHRLLVVRDADLVIESGGRMRALAGRALLPALLPAGVSLSDIR